MKVRYPSILFRHRGRHHPLLELKRGEKRAFGRKVWNREIARALPGADSETLQMPRLSLSDSAQPGEELV